MSKDFHGVIPALYACYSDQGAVSYERTQNLVRNLIESGVDGLYVGGSSGECIYQSVDERKLALEAAIAENKGRVKIIAHVACNNTSDSQDLAIHAESLGVDAIAAIPPIYFKLPEHAIANYWNDISAAAPNTDFIIYNIPQLAGVMLTPTLLQLMRNNPRVIGVKNSSMLTQDIQLWRREGVLVFNGPDEQFISGLAMGACGGIGGTYAVMPELFICAYNLFKQGAIDKALAVQDTICNIIYTMCSTRANLYAVMKAILAKRGIVCGQVRQPLTNLEAADLPVVDQAYELIEQAKRQFLS